MNKFKIVINGIIKENPVFCLLLGMCPTLGTTTSAINGMGMGLCTTFVLICSNAVISLLKNVVPDKVRIPAFIVIIASFVTLLQLCMQAYLPSLYESLGLFIPLIVVNCLILGRAESFASRNTPIDSIFDGIGMGLGFTLGLTTLGLIRELLGSGSIFGYKFIGDADGMLVFVLAPGAFIVLGYLIALVNRLKSK
ncbi:MAG: electron transport complex subunit E [Bacteroidales bacterium]|nr:electron transport complex subunit E [Bacteroidales bacterium]MBQ2386785.1 electron transport complex subunit E [Bacteroidales bacterium]MEE0895776.1 electron transport complex subunit E [Bacteroidales bacterium]MEE0900278.1 electron transport complex subunit E [Bacteroidales bacterium]MEE0910739.1 electron transport complex subunit E [Bacteroidales bacterium]